MNNVTIKVSESVRDICELVVLGMNNKLHFKRTKQSRMFKRYIHLWAEAHQKMRSTNRVRARTWSTNGVKHSRPNIIVSVAFVDDKPVGLQLVSGELIMWYVQRAFRKQGIAKQLFETTAKKYDLSERLWNSSQLKPIVSLRERYNILEKSLKEPHNIEEELYNGQRYG